MLNPKLETLNSKQNQMSRTSKSKQFDLEDIQLNVEGNIGF